MKLTITRQDNYSKSELLLRVFFGFFYIFIPHFVALFFISIVAGVYAVLAFWMILFTGKHPKDWFDFQVAVTRRAAHVSASLLNMVDGYPPLGMKSDDQPVQLEVDYPESLDRGKTLLKLFLGIFYVMIPHGLCLFFRSMITQLLTFMAFWVVLLVGKYPPAWHEFNRGTFRWVIRVQLYMMNITDEYPPFSGLDA